MRRALFRGFGPPASQLRLLADLAARGSMICQNLGPYGRPFERRLLNAAVAALRELGPVAGSAGDRERGPSCRKSSCEPAREALAPDRPEPLAAERDFTLVAMVRDRTGGGARGARTRRALSPAPRPPLLATSTSTANVFAAGPSPTRSPGASIRTRFLPEPRRVSRADRSKPRLWPSCCGQTRGRRG